MVYTKIKNDFNEEADKLQIYSAIQNIQINSDEEQRQQILCSIVSEHTDTYNFFISIPN